MKLRPVVEIDNVLNATVFNFGAAFIDYTSTNLLSSGSNFSPETNQTGYEI